MQQQHVFPSTYKVGDADFVVQRNKHHVWVGTIFSHSMVKDSSSLASIQHLSKTVPIQVEQHLEAHFSIMWMKVGTELS